MMATASGMASNGAADLVSALGGTSTHLMGTVFATALSYMAQVPFFLQSTIAYVLAQNGYSPSTYMLQGFVAFGMIAAAITFRNVFLGGLVALSLVGYVGGTTQAPTPVAVVSTAGAG